ncbi:MAG: insulinase family protein [Deltaproteobacteria bacterium]|nr:insulinase family protein [Deltaproteobacteria bacterium]MBM4298020.1 insulinase family protein [Deltaproteobacteria bacterium]
MKAPVSPKLIAALVFVLALAAVPPSLRAGMAPARTVLDNGMVLLTSEQRALPIVSIELLIDAGARYDRANQEGLANLTARLLTYGSARRNALQISDTLDFLGASLSAGCGDDLATISMSILKKDLAVGLELLAEILTTASFPVAEVERQKQAVIASIQAREEEPGDIAQRRFAALLYPQSPYGKPTEGSAAAVRRLTQRDLRDFFQRHYRPNRTIMSVVGDVSQAEISRALTQALRGWNKGEPGGPPVAPAQVGGKQAVRVNKDLTQANIILGHQGVGRENPDYYAIQVMNYILGGGDFSSRAMETIRNQKGLAYSVYSYFSPEKNWGTFQFVLQTKNESALEAVRLAEAEMRRMREELVSEQELSDAKDFLTGSFPLRFDTNRKVANFLASVEYYQLGLDYPQNYYGLIQKVARADVQRVAQKYLLPDKLITVIVGNQGKIGGN